MNLNSLFKYQKELDERILTEHKLEGQDLIKRKILAAIVELGETSNEARFFKFWSKDQKARTNMVVDYTMDDEPIYKNPLLEEYIDVIHFTLSIALEYGYTEHKYTPSETADLTDRTLNIVYLMVNLPYVQEKVRENHLRLIFDHLIALGYQFGFTEEQVINAYHNKNQINHARQETGY